MILADRGTGPGKLPTADRLRLVEAIDRLRAAPADGGVLKGEFAGLRRLRVGR